MVKKEEEEKECVSLGNRMHERKMKIRNWYGGMPVFVCVKGWVMVWRVTFPGGGEEMKRITVHIWTCIQRPGVWR